MAPPSSSSLQGRRESLQGRRETSAGRTHVSTSAPLDLATNIIPGIPSAQGDGGDDRDHCDGGRLCKADRIPAIRDTYK
jgi:hypothetical protein